MHHHYYKQTLSSVADLEGGGSPDPPFFAKFFLYVAVVNRT